MQEYPLTWPEGWARTASPKKSQFKTTLHAALNNVKAELARFAKDSGFKVDKILISTNYTLSQQNPAQAGVAVYFTWDGIDSCIAVDRYTKIEDNLQAIFRVIEAERTKLRHGGLNVVRAAFRGYAALPPPSVAGKARIGQKRHWSAVLNVKPSATLEEIAAARNKLAKESHPDSPGGSNEAMAEINAAYAAAKAEKG